MPSKAPRPRRACTCDYTQATVLYGQPISTQLTTEYGVGQSSFTLDSVTPDRAIDTSSIALSSDGVLTGTIASAEKSGTYPPTSYIQIWVTAIDESGTRASNAVDVYVVGSTLNLASESSYPPKTQPFGLAQQTQAFPDHRNPGCAQDTIACPGEFVATGGDGNQINWTTGYVPLNPESQACGDDAALEPASSLPAPQYGPEWSSVVKGLPAGLSFVKDSPTSGHIQGVVSGSLPVGRYCLLVTASNVQPDGTMTYPDQPCSTGVLEDRCWSGILLVYPPLNLSSSIPTTSYLTVGQSIDWPVVGSGGRPVTGMPAISCFFDMLCNGKPVTSEDEPPISSGASRGYLFRLYCEDPQLGNWSCSDTGPVPTGLHFSGFDSPSCPSGFSIPGYGIAAHLCGVVTTPGTYRFWITLIDFDWNYRSQPFTVIVTDPLAVTTKALPNSTVGHSYATHLTAKGGYKNFTWSKGAGTLPTGMSLSPAGVLHGLAKRHGTYHFTAKVRDKKGHTAQRAFVFEVKTST